MYIIRINNVNGKVHNLHPKGRNIYIYVCEFNTIKSHMLFK